jgi:dipeptidyl aminopeptidase/acylaminoacyl peptidase
MKNNPGAFMPFVRHLKQAEGKALNSLLISAACLCIAASSSLCLAQNHVMQPSDIANLKTMAEPKLSPDGHLVAFSVHTPAPATKPRNEHIWLASTDKPGSARAFIYGSGVDTNPIWSPDGKHLAFLSNRPNPLATPGSPYNFKILFDTSDATANEDQKNMQIWWIAIDGGEAEPLTYVPSSVSAFKFSGDGKRIAFISTEPDSKAEQEKKKNKIDEHYINHNYKFARLWTYDITTHEAKQLTQGEQNIDTLDWSPDGTTIVSRVSPTPRIDDYWRVSKVIVFDASTGEQKKVIEEVSGYAAPIFSYDGKQIAYSRFTPTTHITDIHLVRNLETGKDIQLEDKLKGTLAEMRWLPDGKLFVNAYVGAHTEAHIVDTATLATTQLENLSATALEFDLSHDAQTISFLSETPSQPLEVSIWRNNAVQVLTDTNPQTKDWALGTQREVQWTNPIDHHTVYGVLTLPPGYKEGQRYKTVIHLHGGPEEAFTVGFNATWYNYGALLASQGYVVLQPNYRGSAGQEIAFTEGNYKDWGGKDFKDMMSGVDWLEKQGIADPNRLAIGGWSFGGFMTSWSVTHTDRFKAAMAGAAVTDAFTMGITTDIAPSYEDSYLGPLNNAEYDRHSATRFAANCHTPVLVIHGEADVRVPLSQGQEFYNALHFLGREAEMVTYPREPHIFTEMEHQIDSLTRELAWFDKYLSRPAAGESAK